MVHLSDQYVQAASELLLASETPDVVLSGLKTSLHSRYHESLYPLVLTRLLRELPNRLAEQTPTVMVARRADVDQYKEAIEAELKKLHAPSEYQVTYDDSLIGGTILQYQSTRIDNSYKHALKNLYKNIITS